MPLLLRARRIALVTAGLIGAGAAVGALCAAAALAVVLACNGVFGDRLTPDEWAVFLAVAGVFGAVVGAIGAPVVGWGLLRRVPLGRAIAGTALGTIAGGIVGWVAQPVLGAIAGALLGLVGVAAYLRRRAHA